MRKWKLTFRPSDVLQWMMLLLLYQAHDSSLYKMYEMPITVLALAVCGVSLLILPHTRRCTTTFLYLAYLLFTVVFVRVLNAGGIGVNIYLRWASQLLMACFAVNIDPEKIVARFVKLVSAMAAVSLVYFVLTQWDAGLIRSLSPLSFSPRAGVTHYGGILYTVTTGPRRNSGIFSEPGLYQIVLNSALYLLFFIRSSCVWVGGCGCCESASLC